MSSSFIQGNGYGSLEYNAINRIKSAIFAGKMQSLLQGKEFVTSFYLSFLVHSSGLHNLVLCICACVQPAHPNLSDLSATSEKTLLSTGRLPNMKFSFSLSFLCNPDSFSQLEASTSTRILFFTHAISKSTKDDTRSCRLEKFRVRAVRCLFWRARLTST